MGRRGSANGRRTLDRLGAVLDLGKDDVKIERAEFEAEGGLINASGTFGPFEQPVVDIALQATADASRLVEVAKLDEKISGQLSIEAGVKGAVDALTYRCAAARLLASQVRAADRH